ncbi:MAG TPA: carboxylesterase family protein [Steroidobacteraceae bacterium]|nr:carboxylesterase family protein [Steroidobacteraceae bacterium]
MRRQQGGRTRPCAALHGAVLIGLVAVLSAGRCRAATLQPASPTVRVSQGALAGFRQGSVNTFLGVPYAAPPIGRNRWRAPQPALHWPGVRPATRFAASCWQSMTPGGVGPWTHEYMPQGRASEDCLYLNVWTPADPAERRLPVLVWIPGGGFVAGSGSAAVYDGSRFAEHDIVVVTINYRVGLLGFFVTPALAAEAAREHAPAGNYGLQDMIAALRWVHQNIAAFGGDPSAITVGGQSAGAMAVHDLIVSPLAAGLFARAIAESGLPDTTPAPSLAEAEKAGDGFARAKGAPTLAALRALTPQELSTTEPAMQGPLLVPIVDGMLLPARPDTLLAKGKLADVPVLAGIDADEATAFSGPILTSMSRGAWNTLLEEKFGALAPRFAPLYPAGTGAERARSARQLRRDLGLAAFRHWSRAWLPHARSPAYGYLFDHLEPGPESGRWGIFHSSELPYVFGTLAAAPERRFTASDRALARTLSRYWANFIRTGNPNGPGLPPWPRMEEPHPRIMRLGDRPAPRPILPARKLQAMKSFLARGGKPGIF